MELWLLHLYLMHFCLKILHEMDWGEETLFSRQHRGLQSSVLGRGKDPGRYFMGIAKSNYTADFVLIYVLDRLAIRHFDVLLFLRIPFISG